MNETVAILLPKFLVLQLNQSQPRMVRVVLYSLDEDHPNWQSCEFWHPIALPLVLWKDCALWTVQAFFFS